MFGEIVDDTEFDICKVMHRFQIDKERDEHFESVIENKMTKFNDLKTLLLDSKLIYETIKEESREYDP